MSDWLSQYASALSARDAREQAHKPYIDAYTRLANKTSHAKVQATATAEPPPSSPAKGTKTTSRGKDSPASDDINALRSDLANTQKARANLATQLRDVEGQITQLRAEHKSATAQVVSLGRARDETERKLRDRDEELRGKREMVASAQDEMVALGLQLHMAEERAERLGKENAELVERWMKRMGEEAERVNRDSRWE